MTSSQDDSFFVNGLDMETQPMLPQGRSSHSKEDEVFAPVLSPCQQVQFILGGELDLHGGCLDGGKHPGETPCLFTEMLQLRKDENGETLWRETARWIRFEESVEKGGDRWSKPHVSTVSLHSAFELRFSIVNGIVQLDMAASELSQVVDQVLEQLLLQGHIPREGDVIEKLRSALLSGFEHQGERKKSLSPMKSVASFASRRSSDSHLKSRGVSHNDDESFQATRNRSVKGERSPLYNGKEKEENVGSFSEGDKKCKVPYFMKKIPTGAEAFSVMVGEVDFLQKQVVAFVRLQESVQLARVVEVPIPSRFLFIILGPKGHYKQYHEVGRSIATLMTDEVFHEVAYKAKTRKDILSGIDEFLDHVTFLPPGAWDAKTRIQPPKELPENQKSRLVSQPSYTSGDVDDDEEELIAHAVSPELQRTGRLFGGMINDIKRKAPYYASDFKDCLSIQCLASFIFLYFAILTPIVTFGGLLGDATQNYLGTMESILGGAVSGTIYHLFSGQPLTIIGSTGPILVFEKIMFEICTSIGFTYISFRFWVGVWTGFLCLLLVAFDASSLISYVTRYTEESFSALISFIFIYEAFKKLIHEGDKLSIWYGWEREQIIKYDCGCHPPDLSQRNISYNVTLEDMKRQSKESITSSHSMYHKGLLFKLDNESYACAYDNQVWNITDTNTIDWNNLTLTECISHNCGDLVGEPCQHTPDAIMMSIILFFGTFTISMFLKGMKTSRYFPTKVRSIVSDFAVTIAIALMVLFDMKMDISTSKLTVPPSFRPTREERKWLIDPFDGNPWWSAIVAFVPAVLAMILIFMDQQITAVIVNRRENKLKKGCGYHLDLFIVSIMLIFCSVLGLPWFVAATVLSITHVNSLKMESETSAPGERAKFLGVREQRVTGIMIFLMIGVSIFLTPILAHIPMPVLYGVFLYMGVSSLQGVQFFDRLRLFFMPPKHQPDFVYLRHVPLPKVYLFTLFQSLGLGVLWFIKSTSPISIVFPMMVAALVGIRKLFDFGFFTQHDLMWLDDLMPEVARKKKEDAKKKKDEEEKSTHQVGTNGSHAVDLPINGGEVLKLPLEDVNCNSNNSNRVNISQGLSETSIWRNMEGNESGNSMEMRNRKES